ncbi:MAG: recombinase zinc beta ribbon domain-containing protein [Acidimicrobiales bacterium]|nr:recombinase zinc beta ribbon domain-containing protein [Acidimicrobiales bacterium]
MEQVAAEGRPHGGSRRPFGFEDDKITHRPTEVALVRLLVARFLAGESARSLTVWLNTQEVPPSAGGVWRPGVVRRLLSSPRTAGLREFRGEIVGPAIWQPIITPEDRSRVLAIFEERRNSGRRVQRRYLLSGLLRCGRCGHRLYSAPRKTTRRYVCDSSPDKGGCGRMTVVAAPLEEFIADIVLFRLDTPALANALAGKAAHDEDTTRLMEEISDDREQLDELAALYGKRQLPMSEWITARTIIEDRMKATERRLRRATNTSQLSAVIGHGGELRSQWASLNLDRQAAIVRCVLDHAVILPGTLGATKLDPDRVKAVWHL